MIAPLEIQSHEDVVLVRATGDIDLETADLLRDGCLAAVTNDCVGLVLDLSRSEYLDSAGVRALFAIAERLRPHRQRLALVVPADAHMRRVLAIVDVESCASLHESADAALGALRAPAWHGAADV